MSEIQLKYLKEHDYNKFVLVQKVLTINDTPDQITQFANQESISLIKINGFGLTGAGALLALLPIQKKAIIGIYRIARRGCLSIGNMDRFTMGQIFIIWIRDGNRTIDSANPACCALFFIHVAGLFRHFHREISWNA